MSAEQRPFAVSAPAKLNLGLEVVGRRADGFHEIVTILQTVSLVDTLDVSATDDGRIAVSTDDPTIRREDNLVDRAARWIHERHGGADGARIQLTKGIPIAAGLGGGSSDAAATLVALDRLWGLGLTCDDLRNLGSELGSDVPFFVSGGTALATGRGERLERLPPLRGVAFVVVVPRLGSPIPRKTATLYAALDAESFGRRGAVERSADRLREGGIPESGWFAHAFEAPLRRLRPELAALDEAFRAAGGGLPALSGAGPAHYAMLPNRDQAAEVAERLRSMLGERASVFVVLPTDRASVVAVG